MHHHRTARTARADDVRGEVSRPGSRCNRGLAMVHRSNELGAGSGCLAMWCLCGSRWRAVLVRHALFVGSRSGREAARTADITHAMGGNVVDHGLGVDIGDRNVGYVVDRAVVVEPVVAPVPALVAAPGIAEPVVHPAVE